MGGARAGEVASALAVSTFEGLAGTTGLPEELLRTTIAEANTRIHATSERDAATAGMGTTITAALVADAAVSFGHVGDSRAYLWRGGVLQQLSDDHSLVGELVRRGALTPEEAERHPQKNIITRTVGTEPALAVDTWTRRGGAGRRLPARLRRPQRHGPRRRDRARSSARRRPSRTPPAQLVRAANAAGGIDNITALLFRVGDGPPVEAAELPPETTLLPDSVFADEPPPKRRRGRPPAAVRAVGAGRRRRPRRRRAGAAARGALRRRQADGRLAIYQGVPYDLVGDLRLYRRIRSTPIPVSVADAGRARRRCSTTRSCRWTTRRPASTGCRPPSTTGATRDRAPPHAAQPRTRQPARRRPAGRDGLRRRLHRARERRLDRLAVVRRASSSACTASPTWCCGSRCRAPTRTCCRWWRCWRRSARSRSTASTRRSRATRACGSSSA